MYKNVQCTLHFVFHKPKQYSKKLLLYAPKLIQVFFHINKASVT